MDEIEKIKKLVASSVSNIGFATNQHAADNQLMMDLAIQNLESAAKLAKQLKKKLARGS